MKSLFLSLVIMVMAISSQAHVIQETDDDGADYRAIVSMALKERVHRGDLMFHQFTDVKYRDTALTSEACLIYGDAAACVHQAYKLQKQLREHTHEGTDVVVYATPLLNKKTIAPDFIEASQRLNDNSYMARVMLSRAVQLKSGYMSVWAKNRLQKMDPNYEQSLENKAFVDRFASKGQSWAQIRLAQNHMQFGRFIQAESILSPICNSDKVAESTLWACLNLAYTLSVQKDFVAAVSAVSTLCQQHDQQEACLHMYRIASQAVQDTDWRSNANAYAKRPVVRVVQSHITPKFIKNLAGYDAQLAHRRQACQANLGPACYDLAQQLMPRTVCFNGECLQKNQSIWARLRRALGYGQYGVPMASESVQSDITFGSIIDDSNENETPAIELLAETTDKPLSLAQFFDQRAISATEALEEAGAQGLPAEFLRALDKACKLDPTDSKACFQSQWFDKYAQKTGRWYQYDKYKSFEAR